MQGSAHGKTGQAAEVQGLLDDALSGHGGVAMDEDQQALVALSITAS